MLVNNVLLSNTCVFSNCFYGRPAMARQPIVDPDGYEEYVMTNWSIDQGEASSGISQ